MVGRWVGRGKFSNGECWDESGGVDVIGVAEVWLC